jgi:hypothetical protein
VHDRNFRANPTNVRPLYKTLFDLKWIFELKHPSCMYTTVPLNFSSLIRNTPHVLTVTNSVGCMYPLLPATDIAFDTDGSVAFHRFNIFLKKNETTSLLASPGAAYR